MENSRYKFRAWDGTEMKNVDQITFSEQSWFSDGGYGVSILFQPSVILMQYTGLKDKNGKEIYEGDILLSNENINLKTEWNQQCACWWLTPIKDDIIELVVHNGRLGDGYLRRRDLEVIGNIYENPELLK